MQPPIDNQKYFRLNFQETLERFFFNRWTMAETFPLDIEDSFARSIIEQIRYNDPQGLIVYLEPTKGGKTFNLWRANAWRIHVKQLEETKREQEKQRREWNARTELVQRIASKLKGLLGKVDEQTVKIVVQGLIDCQDKALIAPLLQIYGLSEGDLKVIVEGPKEEPTNTAKE